jgi:FG-GAP repeat
MLLPTAPLSIVFPLLLGASVALGQSVTPAASVGAAHDSPQLADSAAPSSSSTIPTELAAGDWAGIHAAYEAVRHAACATEGGFRARNPGQQWTTHFDGRGFTTTPDAGEWTWGLQLESYGWGTTEPVTAVPAAVTAVGQRVSHAWDARLTEWYINDQRGLEHGFTVHSRPEGAAGELALVLAIRGDLLPLLSESGRDVRFVDGTGGTVLNYSGLTVFDAEGQALAAGWKVVGEGLRLSIEEQAAQYPLTIDPIAQQAYLKAANTQAGDEFGHSVAISGNTVVVAADREDSAATGINGDQSSNAASDAGGAYVFVRSGTTWTQQAYLKASNTGAGDFFAYSVAVSGDTVVVGAIGEDGASTGVNGNQSSNAAQDSGAAYVFVRSGTTWTQQAYLKASNTGANDQFGRSVAVSGNTIAVGAFLEDSAATGVDGNQSSNAAQDSGATYIFVRSGTTWTQQAYLKASNTEVGDQFGRAVAVSGNTVVVGAWLEASAATGVNGDQGSNAAVASGAAYVFVRSGITWTQEAYLKASNTAFFDQFGSSVAVSGETVVVGAYHQEGSSGAAYVFVRGGTTWTQQAYLKASNADPIDEFGYAVAISGDTVVVAAINEDSIATGVNGDQSSNAANNAGAVYVYVRSGTIWTQQAFIKASNTDQGDFFGWFVGVSGDTVVIGARNEDSAATGVNGDQSSNAASNSGAVYVFDLDLLPDPWTSLGFGLAGAGGVPLLVGSGVFSASSTIVFNVSNAAPSAPGFLVLGFSAINLPLLGGVLVPFPDVLLNLLTDPIGGAQTQVPVPPLLPPGINLFVQAWLLDAGAVSGWAATNAVSATSL